MSAISKLIVITTLCLATEAMADPGAAAFYPGVTVFIPHYRVEAGHSAGVADCRDTVIENFPRLFRMPILFDAKNHTVKVARRQFNHVVQHAAPNWHATPTINADFTLSLDDGTQYMFYVRFYVERVSAREERAFSTMRIVLAAHDGAYCDSYVSYQDELIAGLSEEESERQAAMPHHFAGEPDDDKADSPGSHAAPAPAAPAAPAPPARPTPAPPAPPKLVLSQPLVTTFEQIKGKKPPVITGDTLYAAYSGHGPELGACLQSNGVSNAGIRIVIDGRTGAVAMVIVDRGGDRLYQCVYDAIGHLRFAAGGMDSDGASTTAEFEIGFQ